jgi:hypothetical protein
MPSRHIRRRKMKYEARKLRKNGLVSINFIRTHGIIAQIVESAIIDRLSKQQSDTGQELYIYRNNRRGPIMY